MFAGASVSSKGVRGGSYSFVALFLFGNGDCHATAVTVLCSFSVPVTRLSQFYLSVLRAAECVHCNVTHPCTETARAIVSSGLHLWHQSLSFSLSSFLFPLDIPTFRCFNAKPSDLLVY